jgi:hypothetical protein
MPATQRLAFAGALLGAALAVAPPQTRSTGMTVVEAGRMVDTQ